MGLFLGFLFYDSRQINQPFQILGFLIIKWEENNTHFIVLLGRQKCNM